MIIPLNIVNEWSGMTFRGFGMQRTPSKSPLAECRNLRFLRRDSKGNPSKIHPRSKTHGFSLQNTKGILVKFRSRSQNWAFATKYNGNHSKIRPRSEILGFFVTKYKGNPSKNPPAERKMLAF